MQKNMYYKTPEKVALKNSKKKPPNQLCRFLGNNEKKWQTTMGEIKHGNSFVVVHG